MKKFFTLISVALLAFAAQANELTVCDGTAVNYLVPINGWYVDQEGTMSQSIYPAEMLADMQNGQITQVKFYPEEVIEFDDCELQLALKTVDENGFETATAITGATVVSTTDVFYNNTAITFNLYQPYEYTGGNLLVQVMVTFAGDYNYVSTYFLGIETENNASFSSYNSYGTPSTKLHQFLPKCTFTYEPGQVTPPTPTEKTGAPLFNGYTTDGIHAYFIEILESEPSVIYFRVQYNDGEFTEWAEYEDILSFTEDGKYRVEAYAIADGKLQSDPVAYEFYVSPFTGLSELVNSKAVAGVRYFNMAGQE
ncbi:MAG: hypothetical protein IJS04_09860, partial [Muribaculaceae bacterium]|nr:hypothetical protein [Muribaculaceae bacterium]